MLRTEGGSWEEVDMENAEVKDRHTIFYRTNHIHIKGLLIIYILKEIKESKTYRVQLKKVKFLLIIRDILFAHFASCSPKTSWNTLYNYLLLFT